MELDRVGLRRMGYGYFGHGKTHLRLRMDRGASSGRFTPLPVADVGPTAKVGLYILYAHVTSRPRRLEGSAGEQESR